MFSFWSRKGNNKSPAADRSANISQDVELSGGAVPKPVQVDPPVQAGPQADTNIVPEAKVAVVTPNPHDAAISEVHAKLLQAEQLSSKSTAHPLSTATDPLTESLHLPNPSSELLYDPATGAQRGTFEPAMTAGSCDSEQLRDEAWTHLARIREIQSEIAMMHVHMESIGDGGGTLDVEVDNDVDVDTVPTQEEEDAAKKEKEFERLPGKFKGRSDNIDAMMVKLDELSKAVTSFHALQPPPLSFESTTTSRQTTDASVPGDHAAYPRTRTGVPAAAKHASRGALDQHALHESPVSVDTPDLYTRT